MGRHRVLLFAVIWILASGVAVANSTTVDSSTDSTNITTPVVPTSTQGGNTTLPPTCDDWKIWDNVTGSIWVTWDNTINEVEIQIENVDPKAGCKFNTRIITLVENPAKLEVCSNENYVVTIDCSEKNETFLTLPGTPLGITFSNVTNSSFIVAWEQPSGSGNIIAYQVQVPETSRNPSMIAGRQEHTVRNVLPYTNYTVQVSAKNSKIWGEFREGYVMTTVGVPHAPSNLMSVNTTNTTLTLEWKEPSPSTGPVLKYIIEKSYLGKRFEVESPDNATRFELSSLAPFTYYTFSVLAVTEAGRGPWSNETEAQTGIGVPHAPSNLMSVDLTNTTVTLEWEEPTPSTGPVLKYIVERSYLGKVVEVVETPDNATRYEFSSLAPFADYIFRVLAETKAGRGPWSNETEVQTEIGVPHAPSNLMPVNTTNTTVTLEWEEPTPSTGPVLKYIVEISYLGKRFEVESPDNATRYEFSSLAPFTNYNFRVLAVTEAGFGSWSNGTEVQTEIGVPHPPTDLNQNEITNGSVLLIWKEPELSTGPIITYIVDWKDGETVDINSTKVSYNVTGLLPYVNYTFNVAASTNAGTGNWSEDFQVQTSIGVPHPPTDLSQNEITNESVLLIWKEPELSTGPIITYIVDWKDGKNGETVDINSTEVSYNVTDLLPYVNYTFKVAASTNAGTGNWSEDFQVQTSIGVPYPPTNLNHKGITDSSVLLTWKEPNPSTGPIITYIVHWEGGENAVTIYINSTEVSYNVTGLLPYVNYTFKVAASTNAGTGNWSQDFQVQTSIGVPHSPTGLNGKKVTNESVLLEWNEPEPYTGPLTSYTIRWKGGEANGTIDMNSRKTNFNVTNLLPYVNYTFEVAASTDAGRGPWSERLSIQTAVGVPHPPTNLNRSEVTNTSVLLTWVEPKPSTGPLDSYTVRWHSENSRTVFRIINPAKSFNVTKLAPYSLYTFAVAASTEVGIGPWSEELKIRTEIGVPTAPRNLRLAHSNDVSLVIQWDRPEFPNAPELNYSLLWRISSEMNNSEEEVLIPDTSLKLVNVYSIKGLFPYTNYSIRVFASTYAGRSRASNLDAETKIAVPRPAVILEAKTGQNRSAAVRWTTPGDYPGPVTYSLQAWKQPGPCSSRKGDYVAEELRGVKTAAEWDRVQTTHVLGLSPYGDYTFLIVLKTSVTDGVASKKSNFIQIPPEEPSEPVRVLAECINSTHLNVSWGPPTHSNGIIDYYNIKYGIEDEWITEKIPIQDMCKNQNYILTELRPERQYAVYVRAHVKGVRKDGKSARPQKVCVLPAGVPYLGNTSHLLAESAGPDSLVFEWTNYTFSDYMGALVRYTVLVGRLESLGNTTSGISARAEPPWSNFTSGASDFYQVTPSEWNPFLDGPDPLKCQTIEQMYREDEMNMTFLRCFIGVQKQCLKNETYCNGPLDPDTSYEMKIRAFTRGGFTETHLLYARSGKLPGKSPAGTIVAIVIPLFVLLSLVGGGYVLKRKGYIQLLRENITSKFSPPDEPLPCRPADVNQTQMAVVSKPVKTVDFMEHVRVMMADCKLRFSAEFEELSHASPKHPCDIAGTDENRPKNRYANIHPFDHSRVKLLPLCDEPGSDYINANYIPGYLSPREFIATQGPLPHTVDDFWRMVWEQSAHMIVMLTSLVERGKTKCEKYWPEAWETQYFNDLIVTCVSESMLPSYTIRIFHVKLGSKERHIKQLHYTNWPDFGSPECPENFISFVSAVRDHLPRTAPGPIVVHCSAGVGRTGTFIAIDRLLQKLLNLKVIENESIDIFGLVLELRNYRTNMVQAEDQYVYIHFCVQHLIQDNPASPNLNNGEHIYSNVGQERVTQM